MGFFYTNAQEEALKNIVWQTRISNEYALLCELRRHDGISEEEYVEQLRKLWNRAHD